jgi:hypothetical protein
MPGVTSLTSWLAGLEQDALAGVLSRRPDAVLAPQPRSLPELAQRLGRAESVAAALQQLPLPAAQVLEALVALGGVTTPPRLAAFMAAGPDHDGHVTAWLRTLTERGIVWPSGEDVVAVPSAFELFPSPLGLGAPLRELIADVTAERLRRLLHTLGEPKPPTRRAEVVQQLTALLNDAQFVRDLVATAPAEVARELRAWAGEGAGPEAGEFEEDVGGFVDELVDELGDGFGAELGALMRGSAATAPAYDPEAYRRRQLAESWASDRGLAYARSWGYGCRLPAEVARALRGPDFRARFTPEAPSGDVPVLAGADLGTHAAAAAARFAELVLALADRIARTPVPALKSGGIGARELARLGKALDASGAQLRLALELCRSVGVLAHTGTGWALAPEAEAWRALEPGERLAGLLVAWWHLPSVPTEATDGDGKAVPALVARACGGCRAARHAWLQALGELGEGAAPPAELLAARAVWRRPFVHLLAQDSRPFDSVRSEAECLGVVAAGALTPAGHALLEADDARLRRVLSESLPAANGRALFGPDLTAVVAGTPSAAVSRLLDAAADRESRGAATVWRLSPGSVRRALDEGYSAADLEDELAAIATGPLPQPLVYLVRDVGARHGALRVSAATSVVRSPDEPLLAQVAADRALRKLGLRLLSPTVLAADVPVEQLLAALRAAGYLPMPEAALAVAGAREAPPADADRPDDGEAGAVRSWLAGLQPRPNPGLQSPALSAAELAVALRSRGNAVAPASGTETALQRLNRRLDGNQLRVLAHAVDSREPVSIDYRSQSGTRTRRVISEAQLFGDSILAWCALRADERWFRVDRIEAVAPVG